MTEKPGDSDRSFDERLRSARDRQGLEPRPKKDVNPDSVSASALGVGLRVGLELVVALVVAIAIGYGLDKLFGTFPIISIVFVPLGGAAGVMNIYRAFAPRPGKTDR
mgnify:CR=1 FL=1